MKVQLGPSRLKVWCACGRPVEWDRTQFARAALADGSVNGSCACGRRFKLTLAVAGDGTRVEVEG